jgi:chromatin remodeling complex protein RSC6
MAAKKPAVKKPAAKKRTVNAAFAKPLTPSPELAEIVGPKALARFEASKKIWDYIKKHDLQDKKNKRQINPDEKLSAVVGKKPITMFELTSKYNKHLSDPDKKK